jgi:hypothetical protein
MAIYSRPEGVDAFKGSSGGVTFQVAGPSSSVRQRRIPRNVRTASNSISRNQFHGVANHWRTLSTGQQSDWATSAPDFPRTNSLGVEYTVPAWTLWNRLNKPLISAGLPVNENSPSPVTFPTLVTSGFELSTEVTEVRWSWDQGGVVPDDFAYIIYLSAQLPSPPSDFDTITLFHSSTFLEGTNMNDRDVGEGWFSKFGTDTAVVGNYLIGRVDIMSMITGEVLIRDRELGTIIFS